MKIHTVTDALSVSQVKSPAGGGNACACCVAEGKQFSKRGSRQLYLLGRQAIRCCPAHEKEMVAIYEGAMS